jgi:hypothetical protein
MREEDLRLLRSVGALFEAVEASAAAIRLLLARIDRMAIAARFHRLLLDRGGNEEHRRTRRTRGFGVVVDRWVDSGLHSGKIVQKSKALARPKNGPEREC